MSRRESGAMHQRKEFRSAARCLFVAFTSWTVHSRERECSGGFGFYADGRADERIHHLVPAHAPFHRRFRAFLRNRRFD